MDSRERYACVFLTTATTADMRALLAAVCPPLEESLAGAVLEQFGAARAFCRVPNPPAGWSGSLPVVVRRCASLAYAMGATRVEYFHEAMEPLGRGPYRVRPPHS